MNIREPYDGIFLIEIPIPTPLRSVNCYLARGRDGWTIVDTGFHTEETELAWHTAFRELGVRPAEVKQIVVTHHHGDHYGAAGWLQQQTGAVVLILDRELPRARRIWEDDYPPRVSAFMLSHGMPADIANTLAEEYERARRRALPHAQLTPVREGERITIGDRAFEVIWAPGHSDGLMVLWNVEERLLIADDMILGEISPNISLWPGGAPDPLAHYLASLDKVSRLPARLTLTGHREPVHDLARRSRELREHHAHRLAETRRFTGARATGWEVACRLFQHALNSVSNMRFALTETVAHLEHLCGRGELVRRQSRDGTILYEPAAVAPAGGERRCAAD
ncbi:MAG TPA: MBL fold metallo-hydrolase [Bacillota bacterium]